MHDRYCWKTKGKIHGENIDDTYVFETALAAVGNGQQLFQSQGHDEPTNYILKKKLDWMVATSDIS